MWSEEGVFWLFLRVSLKKTGKAGLESTPRPRLSATADTANDSNFRDTFFSFLHICQEYRTRKVGKSYMTYAGFIQLPV